MKVTRTSLAECTFAELMSGETPEARQAIHDAFALEARGPFVLTRMPVPALYIDKKIIEDVTMSNPEFLMRLMKLEERFRTVFLRVTCAALEKHGVQELRVKTQWSAQTTRDISVRRGQGTTATSMCLHISVLSQ